MSKIKNTCAICSKEYFHKESKKNSKYCSILCSNRGKAWSKKKALNKNNCDLCHKEYEYYKWDTKNPRFCSIECKRLGSRLTEEQKFERMKKYYQRDVIIKEGCWDWSGPKINTGYGFVRSGNKHILAHRISWIINYGEIPEGMNVLHKCDSPPCTNSSHLFLGTQKDNSIDARDKGRGKGYFSKGNTPHNSSLTDEIVRSIKLYLKYKVTHRVITEKYKVTKNIVKDISRGRTWKHVEI